MVMTVGRRWDSTAPGVVTVGERGWCRPCHWGGEEKMWCNRQDRRMKRDSTSLFDGWEPLVSLVSSHLLRRDVAASMFHGVRGDIF